MHFALNSLQGENDNQEWASLPGLCCQAAGGNPDDAIPLAAAWLLFYAAAKIMDDVEDDDAPEAWWQEIGPKGAISAATGLYFTASLVLSRLEQHLPNLEAARIIREEMLSRFLEMCSGQHFDLMQSQPTLDQYWHVAAAKSGTFFSMACWAGARMATDDSETLAGFEQFGMQIGMIIQILDDLKDLKQLEKGLVSVGRPSLMRSLPVIFMLEVCPENERAQFINNIEAAAENAREIFTSIECNGGVFYLLTELERHRQLALNGLDLTQASQPAKDALVGLLDELNPTKS